MAIGNIHISINAETIFHLGDIPISNSMIASFIVSGLLITFAVLVNRSLKQTNKPTGLQNFAEMLVEALYNMVHSVTGSHTKARYFFPLFATFFLFIMTNNYFGLLPGVGTIGLVEGDTTSATEEHSMQLIPQAAAVTAPAVVDEHAAPTTATETVPTDHELTAPAVEHVAPEAAAESHGPKYVPILRAATADLNTTLALALISVLMTQVIGVKYLGLRYFTKFFTLANPIQTFVGLLELVSEFAKIVSFAFRLFGNIFAGEVLLAVMGALVPLIIPMPFYGLELFVGFVQALVFAMLSLVFFNMATISHDSH